MIQPSKTRENTDKLLKFVSEKFMSGDLDNSSMVELIQLCGDYLNIMTIADYARHNNMTYEGAKKFRNVQEIFGCKFVIDND